MNSIREHNAMSATTSGNDFYNATASSPPPASVLEIVETKQAQNGSKATPENMILFTMFRCFIVVLCTLLMIVSY